MTGSSNCLERLVLQNSPTFFDDVEPVHVQIFQRVHRARGPPNLHHVDLLRLAQPKVNPQIAG